MFNRLKLKFILTNTLTSAAVIIIAFSSIYLIVEGSAGRRIIEPFRVGTGRIIQAISNAGQSLDGRQNQEQRPEPTTNLDEEQFTEEELNKELNDRITADREATLGGLLISLIVTGVAMEAVIVLISFYLAEQSIRPVREAYNAQKAFVANASHEIKTPLAVIQANLEAADIKGNKWINNAERKTEELAALNNQLLTLARMDLVEEKTKEKLEDLSVITTDTINFYIPQIKSKKINLKTTIQEDIATRVNSESYSQILNILIDNAIKYCKNTIEITLDAHTFQIKNDGTTIQKKELKHIFDRFYQIDKTKNGVGLGLSIAKQVADKNNWNLKAKSDDKSTTFILELK